ncbi:hypothetical protein G6F40_016924 [Rhizopus arrhizus]|nr:hypothetical protein G6F40_016924 [Rhizopus arrhizus]
MAERLQPVLHRNGVHHRLALHALQAGLDDLPLRTVDHDRHAGDVGLGGDQVQEAVHAGHRIQHGLVHVDVDDLRTVIDVVARRLGQLLRLGAGDLHADRCRFAVMVHAVDRLARVPEARVADAGGRACR